MKTTKQEMIERQLKGRDITDPNVLMAMREVDRTLFVPLNLEEEAYKDGPLPIGEGQTISQPYIVAYMAQLLNLKKEDTILEVGSGCGYNAAVISKLVSHVYSVEIIEWLADQAKWHLLKAGIENVTVKQGDGYQGWSEHAPYDAIILTAAPPEIPGPLRKQLKVGGKMLAPVGENNQKLVLIEKINENEFSEETLIPVRFVPMTGQAQK